MLNCLKPKACWLTFPDTVLLFPKFIPTNLLIKPEESSRSLQLYVLGYLGMLVCENTWRSIPGCNLKVALFHRGQGSIREKGRHSWLVASFISKALLGWPSRWVVFCIGSHFQAGSGFSHVPRPYRLITTLMPGGSFWEWQGCRAFSWQSPVLRLNK